MGLEENVIEAETLQKIQATEMAEESSFSSGNVVLPLIAIAFIRRKR